MTAGETKIETVFIKKKLILKFINDEEKLCKMDYSFILNKLFLLYIIIVDINSLWVYTIFLRSF